MKTSVVPAQFTTLEDVIAANLTLTQMILLALPLLVSALVFAGLPPQMHLSVYKITLTLVISLPLLILAVRLRGQVLFKWALILIAYLTRARVYLLSTSPNCACMANDIKTPIDTAHIPSTIRLPNKPRPIEPRKILALEEELKSRRVQFVLNNKGQLNALIESK